MVKSESPPKEAPPFEVQFDCPPDTEFSEACSLSNQIEKLQRTVVDPIVQDASERSETVYFDGPVGSGKTWLAQATAGELAASGFSYCQVGSFPDGQEEYKQFVSEILGRARREEPSIVLFEDVVGAMDERITAFKNQIDACLDAEESVLLFLELDTEWTAGPMPRPDVYVQLPDPGKSRLIPLFRRSLGEFVESVDLTINFGTIDFEALYSKMDWCRPGDFPHIVLRIYHHTLEIGAPRITQGCIERAIEEKKEEVVQNPAYSRLTDSDSSDVRFSSDSDDDASRHYIEEPTVTLDEVGGLDDVVQRIREVMVAPKEHPELFQHTTLSSTSGILLHGPPGNGKTLLARALANEMDRTFLSVRGPELKNKWFGESERQIRELFETADDEAPSLIFFDEFDALAPDRGGYTHSPTPSLVNMLLTEMDGLADRGDIVYLAATNRKEGLDQAVLRSGRIDESIKITEPDAEARGEIFGIHMSALPVESDVTTEWFADVSPEGISGAKIEAISRHATHAAIREADEQPIISRNHVQRAIEGELIG